MRLAKASVGATTANSYSRFAQKLRELAASRAARDAQGPPRRNDPSPSPDEWAGEGLAGAPSRALRLSQRRPVRNLSAIENTHLTAVLLDRGDRKGIERVKFEGRLIPFIPQGNSRAARIPDIRA